MQTSLYQAEPPPPKYPRIAVAVNDRGSHVGVLYRFNTDEPQLLHLGWHHQLYDEAGIRPGYAWAACAGFTETEGRDLASWLQKVYRANIGRIPYGINYWPGAYFDDNGVFIPSRDGLGLTCATFVMALFEANAYTIVDVGSWKPRDGDQQWFQWVVDNLNDPEMTPDALPEHIEAQVAAMGNAVRFRPLEVAAAASIYEDDPITFERAVPIAEQFGKDLVGRAESPGALPMQLIAAEPARLEEQQPTEQDPIAGSGNGKV